MVLYSPSAWLGGQAVCRAHSLRLGTKPQPRARVPGRHRHFLCLSGCDRLESTSPTELDKHKRMQVVISYSSFTAVSRFMRSSPGSKNPVEKEMVPCTPLGSSLAGPCPELFHRSFALSNSGLCERHCNNRNLSGNSHSAATCVRLRMGRHHMRHSPSPWGLGNAVGNQ